MKTAYRYAWVRKDGLYMLASATATRRLALSMRGTAETVLRVAVIDLAEYRRLTRIDKLFDQARQEFGWLIRYWCWAQWKDGKWTIET